MPKRSVPKQEIHPADPAPVPAHKVLMQAVAHPTSSNIAEALRHPDLAAPLEGLDVADFKALSSVVGPYVLLRNALQHRDDRDLIAAGADARLADVLSKLDRSDLAAIHDIVGGVEGRRPCT